MSSADFVSSPDFSRFFQQRGVVERMRQGAATAWTRSRPQRRVVRPVVAEEVTMTATLICRGLFLSLLILADFSRSPNGR